MNKKVVYISGTRAEYGVMFKTLDMIRKNPKLDLCLVVTGMHLSSKHGETIREIEKDKFKIIKKIKPPLKEMDNLEMAVTIGKYISEMSQLFNKIKPNIILLQGDRGEMLAAAIAGAHLNIPVIHVSGGDISGSIDNSIRKAITCFSHLHLTDNKENSLRLKKLGEQSWRIKTVGYPGLKINLKKLYSLEKTSSLINFPLKKPFILLLQHPVTGESEESGRQMEEILKALAKLKKQILIIYPNTDAGAKQIIKAINKFEKKYSFVKSFQSFQRKTFLSLMKNAKFLIGNSSSGLVETPLFNLPTINLGTRQMGRKKPDNVINLDYNSDKIYKAALKILNQKEKSKKNKTVYNSINTEKKIVSFLENIKINKQLLNKYGY